MQKRKADKEIENQNLLNLSQKNEEAKPSRERRLSYTLTSPIFEQNLLPNIEITEKLHNESVSSDDNTETIVPATTVTEDQPASEIIISSDEESEITFKSSKDMTNEIDRKMLNSSIYESEIEPEVNNQLKDLIEKQKREYTAAMEALKLKFNSEQENLLNKIESNLLVTSTPMTNMSMITTDDEDFVEFKTCLLAQSNENLMSSSEKTVIDEIDESEKRQHAATVINSYVRGYLTRRLMKTIYVQEHIRNITETLQLVLSLDEHRLNGSPVQNILLKAKLFRQLSTDLKNFNDIFFDTAINEKMKIIASDREIKTKKEAEENLEQLSLSFNSVM